MSTIRIDIVTPEKMIYSGEVDMAVIPGEMGELGILPKHCPLLTTLTTGEIRLKKGEDIESIFISGGFCEVLPNHITVLGDVAERAEDIDAERATHALHRAEELMRNKDVKADISTAEVVLRKSHIRLKIAEKRKKKQQ